MTFFFQVHFVNVFLPCLFPKRLFSSMSFSHKNFLLPCPFLQFIFLPRHISLMYVFFQVLFSNVFFFHVFLCLILLCPFRKYLFTVYVLFLNFYSYYHLLLKCIFSLYLLSALHYSSKSFS